MRSLSRLMIGVSGQRALYSSEFFGVSTLFGAYLPFQLELQKQRGQEGYCAGIDSLVFHFLPEAWDGILCLIS